MPRFLVSLSLFASFFLSIQALAVGLPSEVLAQLPAFTFTQAIVGSTERTTEGPKEVAQRLLDSVNLFNTSFETAVKELEVLIRFSNSFQKDQAIPTHTFLIVNSGRVKYAALLCPPGAPNCVISYVIRNNNAPNQLVLRTYKNYHFLNEVKLKFTQNMKQLNLAFDFERGNLLGFRPLGILTELILERIAKVNP